MKRIGVITMHRVMNVGSVLQAYALCEKINQLGAKAEIIDYQYPNNYHRSEKGKMGFMHRLLLLPQRILYFILYRKTLQKMRFSSFCERKLSLSKYYPDQNSIYRDPPQYDVYLTGSDQVWNPLCMKGDGVFFFDFVKNVPKASYAASFSTNEIPEILQNSYVNFLQEYSHIGVREASAVTLVQKIANKDAQLVCDPTLLLTREDYIELAKDAEFEVPSEPYILVYALSYAYNPYPQIDNVTKLVKAKLGYKVIYLHANNIEHYHIGASITSAGPSEFISLFLNAKFIVTSSFHGTAFAINFAVPFLSIIPESPKGDCRILSLLQTLGLEDRAISTGQLLDFNIPISIEFDQVCPKLNQYRCVSERFLGQIILN